MYIYIHIQIYIDINVYTSLSLSLCFSPSPPFFLGSIFGETQRLPKPKLVNWTRTPFAQITYVGSCNELVKSAGQATACAQQDKLEKIWYIHITSLFVGH